MTHFEPFNFNIVNLSMEIIILIIAAFITSSISAVLGM